LCESVNDSLITPSLARKSVAGLVFLSALDDEGLLQKRSKQQSKGRLGLNRRNRFACSSVLFLRAGM